MKVVDKRSLLANLAVGLATRRVLSERLTYDMLYRMSEPRRVDRSRTVKTPPMEVNIGNKDAYYFFNFKGNPSTTGLRHKGYLRIMKPLHDRPTAVQDLHCMVDCTCPDYRYRWAWSNKQRGAGKVGPGSFNQAHNRAPVWTNPLNRPGLCKHILAVKDFVYGLMYRFPKDAGPLDTTVLDKLTKYAHKRWINFPEQMRKAKEREAVLAQAKIRRRLGMVDGKVPVTEPEPPEPVPLPGEPEQPKLPEVPEEPAPPRKRTAFATGKIEQPEIPPKRRRGRPARRRPGWKPGGGNVNPTNPSNESVVKAQTESAMSKYLNETEEREAKQAVNLVQEMGGRYADFDDYDDYGDDDMDYGGEPTQTPTSDSAMDVDTEENAALGLLREIRDALVQMAGEESAEDYPDEEEFGEPEMPSRPPRPGMGPSGRRPLPIQTGA